MIKRIEISEGSFIGAYVSVTEDIALVSTHLPKSVKRDIKEVLDVEVFEITIAGSELVGVLSVGNSNGILVPNNIMDQEMKILEDIGVNVGIVEDKHTALGNLILSNDYGAIISPLFSPEAVNTIKDTLDVNVKDLLLGTYTIVGSVGIATNKGALLHPDVKEKELETVEKVLKVPADLGTVNHGMIFIGSCMIANSKGVLVSKETTGPELARIEEALGLIEG
ncbi:translation initiation factor eIF-6 [Methanothermus fervidus DSM 2088]|uniref:Translation initiation factor 6 n=1 Tax=Methanothermus fervidus (strain ATCC 43054 / DSM 2088 / JCM 10308 / V24 S) TaxID=523846 RepID=E3GXD7_METFV|nr:translation initiation factor IF-6 [Methanothermus fervidus]ADP76969.1 translation initiation factor eIF-6 [Methanothermus fervidus DSM 2088]